MAHFVYNVLKRYWTIIKKVDKLVERVKSYSRNERERRSC